jgi:hypothetical protein
MDFTGIIITLLLLSSCAITLRAFSPVLSRRIRIDDPARAHQRSNDDKQGGSSMADPPTNGYEWTFKGRAMLRPCLQRIEENNLISTSTAGKHFDTISLFGWTLGGRVALQYDVSPAANGELAYNEFVALGCLGICEHGIGQVGTALYVNEAGAVELCESVWDLDAQLARIELQEEGSGSSVDIQEDQRNRSFQLRGWSNLRHGDVLDRNVQLNLFWTPTITGIWLKLLPWWPFRTTAGRGLPVHRLRVSGNAKLQLAGALESSEPNQQSSKGVTIIPLGVDFILQNALIEISSRIN